jgi:hypothetical protein
MTMNLRSTITARLGWTWRDQDGFSSVVNSTRLESIQDLADGSASLEADAVWDAAEQSLAQSNSTTLELDALERDLFGDTITIGLSKVKAILIVNQNTTGNGYLVVGAAASDTWYAPFGAANDTVKVMPGGSVLLANPRDGWDVQAGATDLKIAAAGGSVTYDIAILGTIAS